MKSARACVLRAPGDLRVESRDIPAPAPGQIRLRLLAGGICGTDRHYFADGMSGPFQMTSPLILGHEASAEVDATGDDDDEFRPGQMVAVNPARTCGECAHCRSGRENLCANVFFFGSASRTPHMQGLFSEFFLANRAQCVAVKKESDAVRVSCAEPLAVALHAVRRGNIGGGEEVLVTGCGPIGLLIVLAARMAGAARIVATDLRKSARNIARQMGADDARHPDEEFPHPFAAAFECSGASAALERCLDSAAPGGRVVMVGNLPPGDAPRNLSRAATKELDIVASFRFADEFSRAVSLLSSGAADVSPMLSETFPLADAPRAFAEFPDDAAKIHLLA